MEGHGDGLAEKETNGLGVTGVATAPAVKSGGRRTRWNAQGSAYDKLHGAFGRMPLVLNLCYFLQNKPIGGHSISLIDDLKEREREELQLRA